MGRRRDCAGTPDGTAWKQTSGAADVWFKLEKGDSGCSNYEVRG